VEAMMIRIIHHHLLHHHLHALHIPARESVTLHEIAHLISCVL
jgi:hypothetical protein